VGTVYNRAKRKDRDGNLVRGKDGKPLKDDKKPKYWAGYKDRDGVWKYVDTKQPSKELAESFLRKLEANVEAGKVGMPKRTSAQRCGALFDEWNATLVNRDAYGDRLRLEKHLRPMFGETNVRDVTLAAIKNWVTAQRKGKAPRNERPRKAKALAPLPEGHKRPGPKPKAKAPRPKREPGKVLSDASIRHNLNLLSRFMAWAVDQEHVPHNPCRDFPQNARPAQAAKTPQPWLDDDAAVLALMKALPEPIDLLFYLGNRAGLRTGELCGLRMSDLEWLAEGVIRVRHSYAGPLKEQRRNAPPKTKWVPAPDDAPERLAAQLKRRKADGAKPEDYLFPAGADEGPGHLSKMAINRAWQTAGLACGVALTWYQATRHSFVSRNLSRGVSLDEVSAAVGHSSPTVTRQFYDHFVRKQFSPGLRAGLPSEPA